MERYNYQRVLGTGNFGKAWLVRSRLSSRPYVVKEVNVSCMGDRERDQAINEVAILARLRHVNIVRYREALITGATGGVLAIVMEFADGGDLSHEIDRARSSAENFNASVIESWFVQLCFALQYIHAEKILHRDLKPSNLFLTSKGILKVGDFGIAKMLRNTLDHASTAIGTPYYLSPEICRRLPYNQKSDMWAAGCVLYELIMLDRPFTGPDFSTLIVRILHGGYTPIPRSDGGVLEELVDALLSSDPERRPSAQDILAFPAMRSSVKCFAEQRNSLTANTPNEAITPRSRQRIPSKIRTNMAASSLYAKSPLPKRQSALGLGHGVSPRSQKSSGLSRDRVLRKVAAKNPDSPWVKHSGKSAVRTVAESRVRMAKMRICHQQSASEPICSGSGPGGARIRFVSGSERKYSSIQRTPSSHRSTFSSRQHKWGSGDEVIAQRHKVIGDKNCVDSPREIRKMNNMKTRPSTGKRRRSFNPTPELRDNSTASSIQKVDVGSCSKSMKKRRRSLPERVKESRFLSRLVSGDGRPPAERNTRPKPVVATMQGSKHVGERLMEGQSMTCSSPMAPPSGLVPRHSRVRSEPYVAESSTATGQTLCVEVKQENVSTIHQSLPPSRRAMSRQRTGSNAPITCLFPKATETSSKKPRSRIKHGTYTLNLPTVHSHDQEQVGPAATCQRCGCKSKPQSASDTKSLDSTLDMLGEEVEKYGHPTESSIGVVDREVQKTAESYFANSPSNAMGELRNDRHTPSPCGKFERGNAIRRPVRHAQRRKVRPKAILKRGQNSSDYGVFVPRDPVRPDIIPDSDDVFLSAVDEQNGSASSEIDVFDIQRSERELSHQMEVAELLHSGMAKRGKLNSSELRGKLERIKEYLEEHIGPDRTLLAYDIMASAPNGGFFSDGSAVFNSSETVVSLVADVIGPGKMKYFPILVEAFNLSNQVE